jgi:hypothetical protein
LTFFVQFTKAERYACHSSSATIFLATHRYTTFGMVSKECVDTLLTKWDAKRNIRRRREFKPEHKRQLLATIAWHFHREGRRYFPENELLEVIAGFLPTVHLLPDQSRVKRFENGGI